MAGFFDIDRWNEIAQTLTRNKRRSIMTALGVFWGILMLIVLLGAGRGMERMFREQLGGSSTNMVFLFSDETSIPWQGMPSGRQWKLTLDDVTAIGEMSEVTHVGAICWGDTQSCRYGNNKGDFAVTGYSPSMQYITPQKILSGRFLNEIDELQRRKVCVLGKQVHRELFPDNPHPEGEIVQVSNNYYTVVGVQEPQGNMAIGDPERSLYIPVTLVQQQWDMGRDVDAIAFTARDELQASEVIDVVRHEMALRHLFSPEDKKALSVFDTSEMFSKVQELLFGIALLTWIVGMGTLLAGIVGISNIMLVLVRERTQEIGIRRAIGAPPRAILTQILSESFILTFIAGVFGLGAGVGILSVADTVYARAIEMGSDLPLVSWQVSFGEGVLALAILTTGGLLAGVIPAVRALKIKAVDAIREE